MPREEEREITIGCYFQNEAKEQVPSETPICGVLQRATFNFHEGNGEWRGFLALES